MKYLATLLFFLGSFILRPVGADALSVQLTGPSSPVTVGDSFDIFVGVSSIDSSDGVIGFDFDVYTGAALDFNDYEIFNPFDFGVTDGFDDLSDAPDSFVGLWEFNDTDQPSSLKDNSYLIRLNFQAIQDGLWSIQLKGLASDWRGLATETTFYDIDLSLSGRVDESGGTAVPEPSTLLLLGSALLGLPVVRRFRKR